MGALLMVVAGFAGGIFVRSVGQVPWEVTVLVLIVGVIVGAAAFLTPRRAYALAAAVCLAFVLGVCRAAIADTPLPSVFWHDIRQRVTYEGVVAADPDLRDANQRVEIRISRGGQTTSVLAVAPRTTTVAVGDTVYVSGTLLPVQPFLDDGGRIFRYDKYLERDGVRFIMNFAFLRVITPAPWYSLPAALARVKHAFLSGLSATMPEPYASLAGGVVIGGKTGLGTDLQNAFVRSGLVQIIVLSGYNVMVVAEWVMAALALTPLSKRWGAGAGALAILLFVGVAGASATALRAMLMAFIALYARGTGRTYAASRALLFVVLLMLVWNPLYLAFDPGFGLSVAATAGLIWLAPVLEQWLLRFRRVRQVQRSETLSENAVSPAKSPFWLNALATTLAAQIAVLPLLLYDTGNLSLVAVPANLLVMPFMPLAMSFSALAGLAGMAFSLAPALGMALAFPGYLANGYLLFIAEKSAGLPLAALTLPPFPFWLVLVAYAALTLLTKRFSTTAQLRLAKKAST